LMEWNKKNKDVKNKCNQNRKPLSFFISVH
jgi:hypothetical protein